MTCERHVKRSNEVKKTMYRAVVLRTIFVMPPYGPGDYQVGGFSGVYRVTEPLDWTKQETFE